jgi:hypothetical protein
MKTANIETFQTKESLLAVPLAMSMAGFVTVFQWRWIADNPSI